MRLSDLLGVDDAEGDNACEEDMVTVAVGDAACVGSWDPVEVTVGPRVDVLVVPLVAVCAWVTTCVADPAGCCDTLGETDGVDVEVCVALIAWLAVRVCDGVRVPELVAVDGGVGAEDGVVVTLVEPVTVLELVNDSVREGDIDSLDVADPLAVAVWLGDPIVTETVIEPICALETQPGA